MTIARLNAVVYALLGVLFGLGFWDRFYEALDLPTPEPSVYAQLAAVLFLGWALLLWTQAVAAAAAVAVNGLAAALLVVWLASGRLPAGALGTALFALAAAVFAALAVAWLREDKTR